MTQTNQSNSQPKPVSKNEKPASSIINTLAWGIALGSLATTTAPLTGPLLVGGMLVASASKKILKNSGNNPELVAAGKNDTTSPDAACENAISALAKGDLMPAINQYPVTSMIAATNPFALPVAITVAKALEQDKQLATNIVIAIANDRATDNTPSSTYVDNIWFYGNAAGKLYYATSPGPFFMHVGPHAANWTERNLGIPHLGSAVKYGIYGVGLAADPAGFTISMGVSKAAEYGTDFALDQMEVTDPEKRALAHLGTNVAASHAATAATNKVKSKKFQEAVKQTAADAKEKILQDAKAMGEPVHEFAQEQFKQAELAVEGINQATEYAQDCVKAVEEKASETKIYKKAAEASKKATEISKAAYDQAAQAQQAIQAVPDAVKSVATTYAPKQLQTAATKASELTSDGLNTAYEYTPGFIKTPAGMIADNFNERFTFDPEEGLKLYKQQIFEVREGELIGLAAMSVASGTAGFATNLQNFYQNYKHPTAPTINVQRPPKLQNVPNNADSATNIAAAQLFRAICAPRMFGRSRRLGLFQPPPHENPMVNALVAHIMTPGV